MTMCNHDWDYFQIISKRIRIIKICKICGMHSNKSEGKSNEKD